MMKFIHFVFLFSIALHVLARATESSESESVDSSRSSSSEELRYNDSLEDLVKIDSNSTAEETKDTETAESKKTGEAEEILKKDEKSAGKTDLEKFDEGIDSDKKEYVQKRAKVDEPKSNSTESLTEDDMEMMDHLNKTMEADEDMLHSNETVLGIDTFGAQGI